jgi:GNAT superfamily N-acetyltransferase
MRELTKEAARKEAIKNSTVMSFFRDGYSETLKLTNPKVMNDKFVKENSYFINDEFETDPQWFVAHYPDRIYRIIRVIYVRQDLRENGIGSKIIEDIKSIKFEESFIQIGVQDTADEKFRRLDSLYKRHAFQRTNFSIDHGNGRSFYDYFWSPREFRVQQRGGHIAPVYI